MALMTPDGEYDLRPSAIMSQLLFTELQRSERLEVARRAYTTGDVSDLYVWEREAIEWLLEHTGDPDYWPINQWTASLLDKVREYREIWLIWTSTSRTNSTSS